MLLLFTEEHNLNLVMAFVNKFVNKLRCYFELISCQKNT